MAKLISATYAEALFELAVGKDKTDEWREEIETIKGILADNPRFNELMLHPQISKEDKLSVIDEAFGGRVDPEITGLIRIVVEKDRYDHIDAIFDDFIDHVKEYRNIGIAWVTTAAELSSSRKEEIRLRLLETTGFTSMEMHYDVDEGLIAGLVIRIGDRVLDSSVRSKLKRLTGQLLQAQV